jgi:hypothetical protein
VRRDGVGQHKRGADLPGEGRRLTHEAISLRPAYASSGTIPDKLTHCA